MEQGLVRMYSSWTESGFGSYRFETINMDLSCTYKQELNIFFKLVKLGEVKAKWDMEELHNGVGQLPLGLEVLEGITELQEVLHVQVI